MEVCFRSSTEIDIFPPGFRKNFREHDNRVCMAPPQGRSQSELPRPIPRNSVESDHGCTSRIYFDNGGDNATLTLYYVTLASHKPC